MANFITTPRPVDDPEHPRRENEPRDEIEMFIRDAYAAGCNAASRPGALVALEYAAIHAPKLRALLHPSPDHIADAGKLVESDGWLDIACAPMDKTPVIIAVPTKDKDGFIVGEAYFDPEHYDGGDWWWANTCYAEYGDGPISDINYHAPARWRPLPPPPAGKLTDADRPSVKGTIPTAFGDSVCFSGIDYSALILVSVCGNSGLLPIKYLLPHQLYVHDVQKLSEQGEVLVCAVPTYSEQINVSSALQASQETSE
ncbi:hypothetical protein I2750_19895 [Bacillus sp. PR5]|nr:hypothetical protein [Bacillus sp. PR5]